jgi:DNA-binding NarL/FixJ family response regulator
MDRRPNRQIRVYLVEDQTLLRESVAAMLELEPEIEVVGTAERGEQAVSDIDALQVDVVLMDLGLPGMNGIETTRLLKERHPDLVVVALTFLQDEHVAAAIEAGASGYILKACTADELVRAVRAAHDGQLPMDPSLVRGLVHELAHLRRLRRDSILTERQVQVLKLVASGNRYRDVATALFISERTVIREMRIIYDSLGVNDAPHAVSEGYTRGLI